MCCCLKSESDFSKDFFVLDGHALKRRKNRRSSQETRTVITKLIISCNQNEDRLGATPQFGDVDLRDAVTVADLVETESRQRVIEIVDGSDCAQFPLKFVQN